MESAAKNAADAAAKEYAQKVGQEVLKVDWKTINDSSHRKHDESCW